MTYVMSDLHGMLDKFNMMKEKLGALGKEDKLYILGDFIDRGPDGIAILLSVMDDPHVMAFIGNHESLALPVLKAIQSGTPFEKIEKTMAYQVWSGIGGDTTATGFRTLDSKTQADVIDFIESLCIFEELEIGGRKFHLSHTLPAYDAERDIHDVTFHEFIWGETDYTVCYDPDVTFVTGHTPTALIDPEYNDRIYRKNGHIAIDCGAAFEGTLGCICLETLEEFYV